MRWQTFGGPGIGLGPNRRRCLVTAARIVPVIALSLCLVLPGPPARGQEPDRDLKSGRSAFLCSLLGTAVPVGLGAAVLSADSESGGGALAGLAVVGGSLVGPSLGHFYAGRTGRALGGIGIRLVAGAAIVGGFGMSFDSGGGSWGFESDGDGDALMAAGAALWVTSTIVDIATAPHSAHVRNEKILKRRASVGPAPIGPSHAPGIRVDVPF
jgi:hypothetical protein